MTAPSNSQTPAVVFDLDGTLVDTAPEFVKVTQTLLAEYDRPPLEPERIRRGVSNGSAGLVTLALGFQQGEPEWEQARLRFLALYAATLGEASQLFPGLQQLVSELVERGIPWGVATNKFRAYAEPLMAMMPLAAPPASLVTPDDVRHSKPHPEPLFLACKTLGVSPHRTIYIGDHKRDIDSGRGAGCRTIAAGWGYIEMGDDPASWGADAVINTSDTLSGKLWEMLQ